jgi:hypothetical protein
MGFRRGDVLVVNASPAAIGCGDTDAKLLRRLHRRGVQLHHCVDLHAKVLLFDNMAVIGSANMSSSSNGRLVEAALLTDHGSIVGGVASLIEQLVQQSQLLTTSHIATLCKIPVVRRPMMGSRVRRKTKIRRLGTRTWFVRTVEMVRDEPPQEQRMIDKAVAQLELDEEPEWIRWSAKGRFARECREGDLLIQICTAHGAKRPSYVCRTTPVLLKQRTKNWTRFYLGSRTGRNTEISPTRFKRLTRRLGYSPARGRFVTAPVDPELADALQRNWHRAAKA